MLEKLKMSYRGPREFVVTPREKQSLHLGLECPQGLPAGTEIRATIRNFRAFGDMDWILESIEVAEGRGRLVVGHGPPRTWDEMMRGAGTPGGGGLIGGEHNQLHLCTAVVAEALGENAQVMVHLQATPTTYAGLDAWLELRVRPQGANAFSNIGAPVQIRSIPGSPSRLEVRTTSMADDSGSIRVVLFATDALANPVPTYRGKLALKSTGHVEGLPAEVVIDEQDKGRCELENLRVSPGIPVRFEALDSQLGLAATSSAVVDQSSAKRHFFGAIHFHTDLSLDGGRQLSEAYAYARDYLNLDVVAATDHAPLGQAWEETLRVNQSFYQPGRFVTLPAWESSNILGHANIYLRSPDVDAGPGYWQPELNPSAIPWPEDAVVVPHHTNIAGGQYWSHYHWSQPNERVRLVEVVQGRGNFEADELDAAWGIINGGHKASVQNALSMGWRLGFVGGTDNHHGFPTQMGGKYIGLTCFLASELTRDAIWQAMDQRSTYATSGVPILCQFSVNGNSMGSTACLGKDEEVYFDASLHGTAPIEVVEVISNGQCVWRATPGEWDVELSAVSLPAPAGREAYYYLRLRQVDGHKAWLSPVWLERKSQGSGRIGK